MNDEASDWRIVAQALAEKYEPNSAASPSDSTRPAVDQVCIQIGSRIGRYTIIGLLGQGGMGVVYRAKQDVTNRPVALKVIQKSRMSSKGIDLLLREAAVLGRLRHQGIAQILDAGVVQGGGQATPYLAMELVEGTSLIEAVSADALPIRSRLQLLAQVCDAVEHAHQKGVIHRDLKPANILIEKTIDGPRAKVLDFGVAKLTEDKSQEPPTPEHPARLAGTIQYMSPEQCRGGAEALDARSDVFALGVVAYELLSGAFPYDLSRCDRNEAIGRIQTQVPLRLGEHDSALKGDLEFIVQKAVQKNLEDRYQTAEELGTDIRRFLSGRPITARRRSVGYVTRRFLSRHRVPAIGAAVVLFALVLAGWAKYEKDQSAKSHAQSIASLALPFDRRTMAIRLSDTDISDVFGARSTTADEVLSEESATDLMLGTHSIRDADFEDAEKSLLRLKASVEKEGTKRPEFHISVLKCLAYVYNITYRNLDSSKMRAKICDITQFIHGPNSVESAIAKRDLARSKITIGQLAESRTMLDESQSILEHELGPEHEEYRLAQLDRIILEAADGNADKAIELSHELLARAEGSTDIRNLPVYHMTAGLLTGQMQFDEAQRVLNLAANLLGNNRPNLSTKAKHQANVGYLKIKRGDYTEGIADLEGALDLLLVNFAGQHAGFVANVMLRLAGAHWLRGDYASAESVARELLATFESSDPRIESALGKSTRNSLAVILRDSGKWTESLPLLLTSLESAEATLGPNHIYTSNAHINLAKLYLSTGELDLAETHALRSQEIRRQHLDNDHSDHCETDLVLAQIHAQRDPLEVDANEFEEAIACRIETLGGDHALVAESRLALAECLLLENRLDDAHAQWVLAGEILRQHEILKTHKFWQTHDAIKKVAGW